MKLAYVVVPAADAASTALASGVSVVVRAVTLTAPSAAVLTARIRWAIAPFFHLGLKKEKPGHPAALRSAARSAAPVSAASFCCWLRSKLIQCRKVPLACSAPSGVAKCFLYG